MREPWRERSRWQNECHPNPARTHARRLQNRRDEPATARHSPLATSHPVDKYDAPSALGSQARRRFHVMVKPGGSTCNLDCKYCFYLSKETLPNGPGVGRMSDETLEKFIQQYIAGVTGPEVVFSWQGGDTPRRWSARPARTGTPLPGECPAATQPWWVTYRTVGKIKLAFVSVRDLSVTRSTRRPSRFSSNSCRAKKLS